MIDFPASPTDGQLFTTAGNGVVYKYSAAYSSWLAQNPAAVIGGTGDFFATGTALGISTASASPLALPTVVTGNGGVWYSVSTGRYVPPAGRYALAGWIEVLMGATAGSVAIYLYKNGTQLPNARNMGTGVAAGFIPLSISAIVDANGSDYFELRAFAFSASAPATANDCGFSASPLTGLQGPTGLVGPVGLLSGAGPPTGLTATKGTLYTNTTATTTTTRLYINTDGGTTWANFTASA